MKKIVYTFIVALWLLTIASIVKANEDLRAYEFHIQELPAVCGTQKEVEKYAKDNNYVALNYSLGREGSDPTGQPVFVVTYYVNEDVTQTMATVVVPNSDSACILYITYDVIHNEEELKKGKYTKWQEERY